MCADSLPQHAESVAGYCPHGEPYDDKDPCPDDQPRYADDAAVRLAEIRGRLKQHTQAGRYFWDIFTGPDVEFLLRLIDGADS